MPRLCRIPAHRLTLAARRLSRCASALRREGDAELEGLVRERLNAIRNEQLRRHDAQHAPRS